MALIRSLCANNNSNMHSLLLISNRVRQLSAARFASTLGFIGLGNMGASMATNLAKSGHRVQVFDLNSSAMAEVVAGSEGNAVSVDSPKAVLHNSTAIVTMLPSSREVSDIYLGDTGLLAAATGSGKLFIDSTTGSPAASAAVAAAATDHGCSYIDAPVSGGVLAAKNAQLTFMCGGAEADFSMAEPLLATMGKKSVHCGSSVGSGNAAKVCNNMLLAISMLGTCEAMNLGQQLGLDAKKLAEVLNASSGRCWSSELYNPVPGVLPGVPASRNYNGGFLCSLMLKDLCLAMQEANAVRSAIPMGALAQQLYSVLCAQGLAAKDFSVFYQFLQSQTKAV